MRKKHIENIKKNRIASAPYNFVRLPEKIFYPKYDSLRPWEKNDQFIEGTYSGFFEIEIKAETLLYIRCGPPLDKSIPENPKENPERRNFFHHGDPLRPVIPGSSLRGMLRTLVEILSYSKLQWFNNKRLIYRSVFGNDSLTKTYQTYFIYTEKGVIEYPSSKIKAGYLKIKGNERFIIPAKCINGHTFVHIYEDISIPMRDNKKDYGNKDLKIFYIKPPVNPKMIKKRNVMLKLFLIDNKKDIKESQKDIPESEKSQFKKIVLIRSGKMDKKKMHCAMYEPDFNKTTIRIPPEIWNLYEEDAKLPRGKDKKVRILGKPPAYKTQNGEELYPLFYLLDDSGKLLFFGPTMMFRIPYKHSIQDKIPQELRDPSNIDIAEAIFGIVREKPKEKKTKPLQIKGRVYFEDCVCTEQGEQLFLDYKYKYKTPKILSNPKPTTFQHYLVQDSDDPQKLKHWDSDTEIRGHKLYWHKPKIEEKDIFEPKLIKDPQDTQHTIIRPVNRGTTFRGKIHFDNLNELELGALICALYLPEDKRHHLGMGKPLGMGSVKITAKLNLIDRKKRYERLFDEQGNTDLGLIDENQTQQIAENCLKTFKEKIIQHCLKSGEINNKVSDIWDIPRIAELGVLLKWNPQISQSSLEEISYQGLEKFRKRPVLPNPIQVENILIKSKSINYKPSLKRGSRRFPSQKKSKSKK